MFPIFTCIRIFLIRHGESEANVDNSVHQSIPDRSVELTDKGVKQAHEAGQFLSNKIVSGHRSLMFRSSYKRATQTANIINSYLNLSCYEDDRIVELNHGYWNGFSKEEIHEHYPEELKFLKKQKKNKNSYFTKELMGESPFDVSIRLHSFWHDIENKYIKSNSIDNLIIVSHGETINVMIKNLLGKDVDWYEEEDIPNNCSIRLLELHDNICKVYDRGFILL